MLNERSQAQKSIKVQLYEILEEREKKKKKANAKWQKDQCLLDFELGQGRLTVNIISNTALGANWLYVPIYTDMLIWQTDPSLSILFHAKYCA